MFYVKWDGKDRQNRPLNSTTRLNHSKQIVKCLMPFLLITLGMIFDFGRRDKSKSGQVGGEAIDDIMSSKVRNLVY